MSVHPISSQSLTALMAATRTRAAGCGRVAVIAARRGTVCGEVGRVDAIQVLVDAAMCGADACQLVGEQFSSLCGPCAPNGI